VELVLLTPRSELDDYYVMAPFTELLGRLHNWGVNAAKEHAQPAGGPARFGLAIRPNTDAQRVTIVVLQSLSSGAARDALAASRNFEYDRTQLRLFDVDVTVSPVSEQEAKAGFNSAVQLEVPRGFFKRRSTNGR